MASPYRSSSHSRHARSSHIDHAANEQWAKSMTDQFRQRLSRNRLTSLSRQVSQRRSSAPPSRHASQRSHHSYHSHHSYQTPYQSSMHYQESFSPFPGMADEPAAPPSANPPSYTQLANLPLMPIAPADPRSQRFRSLLFSLSSTPLTWENPGLLDEALQKVPIDQIQSEAEYNSQIMRAEAESLGQKPAWGYQDCVVQALMKWFRTTWFSWVNNPACENCGLHTASVGRTAATDVEAANGATRVELYQCRPETGGCGSFVRFPRYSDAFVLMQTRRGRLGEWVNCFSMLCRAINARVRWVWNSEDHVWTEVYSVYAKRWVHVDVCEGTWDRPRIYAEGWKRRIGYCIAFAADNAVDVTRRYCRNPAKHGGDRSRTPEACLLHILREIKTMRRRDMPKKEKFRLEGEDMREQKELQNYVIMAIAAALVKMDVHDLMSGGDGYGHALPAPTTSDAQKAEEARLQRENNSNSAEAPHNPTTHHSPHHNPHDTQPR